MHAENSNSDEFSLQHNCLFFSCPIIICSIIISYPNTFYFQLRKITWRTIFSRPNAATIPIEIVIPPAKYRKYIFCLFSRTRAIFHSMLDRVGRFKNEFENNLKNCSPSDGSGPILGVNFWSRRCGLEAPNGVEDDDVPNQLDRHFIGGEVGERKSIKKDRFFRASAASGPTELWRDDKNDGTKNLKLEFRGTSLPVSYFSCDITLKFRLSNELNKRATVTRLMQRRKGSQEQWTSSGIRCNRTRKKNAEGF